MQTSFTISARESVRLSDLDIFDAVLNFERLSVEPASQYDTEKPLTNITEVFTLDENDAAMIVRYQHTRSGQYLLTLDCGVGTLSRALSVVAATPSALTSFLGISARCGPGTRDVAKSPASAAQFDSANVAGVFALRARGEIDLQATKEAGLLAQGIDDVHDVFRLHTP